MSIEVRLDRAQSLRLATEGLAAVEVGVVVDLDEGLQRDAEPLAVAQHSPVMIGQAPGARIDIQVLIEPALLSLTSQFRITIAPAQSPVAAAGAGVVFEYLDPVAGIAQFVGGHESSHARTQD